MLYTVHGIPYPSGADPVQEGNDVMQAIALAIDPAAPLSPIPSLAAVSGWTLNSSALRQLGPLCFASLNVSKTGSAVGTADGSGNLTDTQMLTGLPAAYRPSGTMMLNFRYGTAPNLTQAFGEVRTDGTFWITNGLVGVVYGVGTYAVNVFYMLGI